MESHRIFYRNKTGRRIFGAARPVRSRPVLSCLVSNPFSCSSSPSRPHTTSPERDESSRQMLRDRVEFFRILDLCEIIIDGIQARVRWILLPDVINAHKKNHAPCCKYYCPWFFLYRAASDLYSGGILFGHDALHMDSIGTRHKHHYMMKLKTKWQTKNEGEILKEENRGEIK